MDVKNMMGHLKGHQSYPATKEKLIAECDGLSEFSDADKEWFRSTLPEGTYNSADEVMKAVGIEEESRTAMA